MAFYTDVNAGDTILAAHPNALYDDISDLTAGHNHNGVTSRIITNNIQWINLSTDFSTASLTWVNRTGALLTFPILNSGNILFKISSTWALSGTAGWTYQTLELRINRDSGTEYVYCGKTGMEDYSAVASINFPFLHYFTGLSVGNHTFQIEAQIGLAGVGVYANNNCSSDPESNIFRMFAMEV